MTKINLNEKIPCYEYYIIVGHSIVLNETKSKVIIFDWVYSPKKVPTWKQLLKQAGFSTNYKGIIHIIAEAGNLGSVYQFGNEDNKHIYEYGKTEGYW